jgi:hypothetical protein
MRSLWRILALQWLRGDGSQALTEDSAILEGLPYGGNAGYRDDRTGWVYLEFSGDAVLRHQGGAATSPWRVMSVRQSGTPAPLRRNDAGDRAGVDRSEALSRGASHDQ